MENKKIKKVNLLYLISYIMIPIIICAICFYISYLFFPKGTGAVILLMVPPALSFIWWFFGGEILYKQKRKAFEKELDEKGFARNQTFYTRGKTVIINTEEGKIGLLFFFNPFESFIVDAKRVEKAWVDDGKTGIGFMEGSSQVSFLFKIDNIKIRVYTFTSNQRFRMDSNYILTGISKADLMVKAIEEAKGKTK